MNTENQNQADIVSHYPEHYIFDSKDGTYTNKDDKHEWYSYKDVHGADRKPTE